MKPPKEIQKLLRKADIKINGSRPHDIQVHNDQFYNRVLSGGSLALGETYIDGWWDAKKVDEVITRLLSLKIDREVITPNLVWTIIKTQILNMQTFSKSKKVAEIHYDISNDFYKDMLDKNMQYTCAYWKRAKTLEQAQKDKLDLVCRKLQLKKGETVLELGGGWGGFAYHAAKHYGAKVTSYNISTEQVKYAREKCKGLPVNIVHDDYRNAKGTFDKIASIGMCEHVGPKNHRKFMQLAHHCLKPHGLFLLHTIGKDVSVTHADPWINKYIFPNGVIPSLKQLSRAAEGFFVMEDWHNLDVNYDLTLQAWHSNFKKNWPKYKKEYGERFYRMWTYYLCCSMGFFRSRRGQLWQIVFSKDGLPGGYSSER